MIAKEFEDFLLSHLDNYLIPAEKLAIFIDSHSADHVILLLTSNGYSRVPVISKDKHYKGTISISDILSYKANKQLADWEITQLPISEMVNTKLATLNQKASLTDTMHLLVDNPFLSVLDDQGIFQGIITRKSILKAVNSLLHDFTDSYDIIAKED